MYIYSVQILEDSEQGFNSLLNKTEIIHTIPKGYIKLFVSYYPYEIVKKEHEKIYNNKNIFVSCSDKKILIDNFDKIQSILEYHESQFFYYYSFQNFHSILKDIESLFEKILPRNITLKECDTHKFYPKLDEIVRRFILHKPFDELVNLNNYYNPCYKDFSKYQKSEEYKSIKEFEHIKFLELGLIGKLSKINNNSWKENINALHNILCDNRVELTENFIEYFENDNEYNINVLTYKTWDGKLGIINDIEKIKIIQKDYFSEFTVCSEYHVNDDLNLIEFKNNQENYYYYRVLSYLDKNNIYKVNDLELLDEKKKRLVNYFTFEFCYKKGEILIASLLEEFKHYVKRTSPGFEKNFYFKNFTPLLHDLGYTTKRKKDGIYCIDLKIK